MRFLVLFVNLVVATALPTLLLGPAESTSYAESLYRGWRINRAREIGLHSGVDTVIDAGQPFSPELETTGRWAALWVGHDANGPAMQRYAESTKLVIIAIPILASCSAWLVRGAALFVAPWLVTAIWLLKPNAEVFNAGLIELSLFGSVAGLYLAGLRRMHREPGILGWLAVAGSSCIGWQLFPLVWLVFFLPATAAWLIVAWRHSWSWQGVIALAALAGALPSLARWCELYRLHSLSWELIPAEGRQLWSALGESTNRASAVIAIHTAIAVIPLLRFRQLRQAGIAVVAAGLSLGLLTALQPSAIRWDISQAVHLFTSPALPRETQAWLKELANRVDNTARILCEAADGDTPASFDSYSLALQTTAPVLVGVRSEADAVPWSFAGGRLNGRSLNDWSDDEIARFLARWNIGWSVTRSPTAAARLERYPAAVRMPIDGMPDGVVAFAFDRKHLYVLKGSAQWAVGSNGGIQLTDVIPEAGEVVLSLRYHSAWQIKPTTAILDLEVDPYDTWPIVRIRLNHPVDGLTLGCERH